MRKYLIIFCLLGASFLAISPSLTNAQAVLSNPSWVGLTPNQKDTLSSLQEDWQTLSPEQKNKWIGIANRYENRSQAEKDLLKSRMSDWSKLSQNDRRVARANYLSSLDVPTEKKAEAWEAYQQLSPEEKKRLAEEAAEQNKTKKPSLVNAPTLKN
jgi:hypothetical protein